MAKLLVIVSIFWMLNTESFSSDSGHLGYYQNMGALTFAYAVELFENEDNLAEKMRIAREVSYVMFYYWTETRIGKLKPSRKVDVAIQATYRRYVAYKTERLLLSEVFHDPLRWREFERPKMGVPEAIMGISKADYLNHLNRYHDFLLESQ